MENSHVEFFIFMKKLKTLITPYKCKYNKIRIGHMSDGGYVIADLPHAPKYAYSYGSSDNIVFENGIYEKYGTKSYTYDHTINGITNKPEYIKFKKEGVAHCKTQDCDTIQSHMSENGTDQQRLLLKIDIDYAEWPVMYTCDIETLKKFDQIAIELHFFQIAPEMMLGALEKLDSCFKIIHMNPNVFPINPYLDIEFPKVIELTYLRKDLFDSDIEIDMDSVYPDPVLDPVYPIQFPEMKWWKRKYEVFNAVSLKQPDTD
jgi:hypothetical protein